MSLTRLKSFWSVQGPIATKIKYVAAAIALLGIGALGTTFASNISLNSGAPVEFGQGVLNATACDNEITITPYSSFVNEVGAGSHFLTSLKISGIDSRSDKCSGKTFQIKAYGQNGILDLFNYSDSSSAIDYDYNSIEILNTNGVFTWISGGTDGDDVENDANVDDPARDLTDTSFTINLTSNANPIIRTPLADAQLVKSITVETYDVRLLANRILSTSQIGIYTSELNLDEGLDPADALIGGNFSGTCVEVDCVGYFTVSDWIANMTDEDVASINSDMNTSGLTRSQITNSFTAKFTYDSGQPAGSRWAFVVIYNGVDEQSVNGTVMGFDGNSGYFLADEGPGDPIFFSLNGALQSNSSIGSFTPYGDQPGRLLPIRDLLAIWTLSDTEYSE